MNKWAKDLVELAHNDWSDVHLLNTIHSELKLRTSTAGRKARALIEERLLELTAKKKEWDDFRTSVTEWEIKKYLKVI